MDIKSSHTGTASTNNSTIINPGASTLPSSTSNVTDPSPIIYTPPNSTSTMSTTIPSPTDQNLGYPNISVREYIYFIPHPLPPGFPIPYSHRLPSRNPFNLHPKQFEPTSTLVLTSPKNVFVDLRFYKPSKEGDSDLPNKGERDRLEWAFAGTSDSTGIQDPHAAQRSTWGETDDEKAAWVGVNHSTWTHWIDSRFRVGATDIPVDQGDMYPIAPDLTLEVGTMYQPLFKCVKGHEEMWRDVDALATTTSIAGGQPRGGGKKACVVLRLQNDDHAVRGLVVRIGQFVQGIVMKGEYSTVERWEYDFGAGDAADGREMNRWRRTARIGDQFLPCMATVETGVLSVGGTVKYFDYEWNVEEVWEW